MLSQEKSCHLVIGSAQTDDLRSTKLTTAQQGFEYCRACDQVGVCRVVRGEWAVQRLIEEMPHLTASKTKLFPADWS